MNLTPLERDALLEAFNLGAGRAAGALEAMVGGQRELQLSVPRLESKSPDALAAELEESVGPEVCGVLQSLSGAFRGKALLLYSEEESLRLVQMLLHGVEDPGTLSGAGDGNAFTQLESDAFLEVGNVVLNACLGSLGNALEFELDVGLPSFHSGSARALFLEAAGYSPDEELLHLKIDFRLEETDLSGHIGLFLDGEARKVLAEHLTAAIERLGIEQ